MTREWDRRETEDSAKFNFTSSIHLFANHKKNTRGKKKKGRKVKGERDRNVEVNEEEEGCKRFSLILLGFAEPISG